MHHETCIYGPWPAGDTVLCMSPAPQRMCAAHLLSGKNIKLLLVGEWFSGQ